jgi:hypothetical protein
MSLTTQSTGASALVPRDMREAMELAKMMASTGFLARELQNPGGAMFVMEQAMRWSMSPFAVAMETSFIQGKPMFSGKIVAAAVVSSGAITGRLAYAYDGQGDNRTITVSGTVRGEAEPRTVTVRLADARTQNKVWASQPDQQLAYHGARVWARRHTPEVMLGVYSEDEFEPATPMQPARGPVVDAAAAYVRQAEPVQAEPATPLQRFTKDATLVTDPTLDRWVMAVKRTMQALAGEGWDALSAWWATMAPHVENIRANHDADAAQHVEDQPMEALEVAAAVQQEVAA